MIFRCFSNFYQQISKNFDVLSNNQPKSTILVWKKSWVKKVYFSATSKDLKLKFLRVMKNLFIMKLQKRKSQNINHRIFTSLFPKSLVFLTGRSWWDTAILTTNEGHASLNFGIIREDFLSSFQIIFWIFFIKVIKENYSNRNLKIFNSFSYYWSHIPW